MRINEAVLKYAKIESLEKGFKDINAILKKMPLLEDAVIEVSPSDFV